VFQDALRSDAKFRVLPSSPQLYTAGLNLYRRRRDKLWQLTDCVSFAAMKQQHLREALTGDQHFKQAGFTALLSPFEGLHALAYADPGTSVRERGSLAPYK